MLKISFGTLRALAVLCLLVSCNKNKQAQNQNIFNAATNQNFVMEQKFIALSEGLHDYSFLVHKHLAENPETAWQEFETTKFLCTELDKMGIPYRIGRKDVGIIAEIACQNPDFQTVFLRADIDQLFVPEEESYPKIVKSKIKGLSAACGHSVHTAWVLSATKILWQLRHQMKGKIVVLFQPAEESNSVGSGMEDFIKNEGLLDYPNIVAAFGAHCTPTFNAKDVHLLEGEFMASVGELHLIFLGKSGHVQNSDGTRNSVDAACEFNVALRGLKSQFSALKPILLAANKIKSNNFDFDASNIVADTTWTTTVYRTFDQELSDIIRKKLIKIAENIAENNDCKVTYDDKVLSKTVKNDPTLTQWSRQQLTNLFGKERVKDAKLRMGGDDFSHLTHLVPSVYIRIGTGGSPEFEYELHDKRFQVNPEAIDTGVATLAYLVFKKMSS